MENLNTTQKIKHILGNIVGVEEPEMTPESALVADLNAAPEDLIAIFEALEEEFEIKLTAEDRHSLETVGNVIAIVKDHLNELEDE